jgi:hypothetical protein
VSIFKIDVAGLKQAAESQGAEASGSRRVGADGV